MVGEYDVECVARQLDPSDFESCLRTFGHEFDREVCAADKRYEQVGVVARHEIDFLLVRLACPVQVTAQDCGLYACNKPFTIVYLPEIKEENLALDVVLSVESHYLRLAGVKGSIFDVYECDGGFDTA